MGRIVWATEPRCEAEKAEALVSAAALRGAWFEQLITG